MGTNKYVICWNQVWLQEAAARYPDQAELRIQSFLSEPRFGDKEPPPGTPVQAGFELIVCCRNQVLVTRSRQVPSIRRGFEFGVFLSEPGFSDKEPPLGTPDQDRKSVV